MNKHITRWRLETIQKWLFVVVFFWRICLLVWLNKPHFPCANLEARQDLPFKHYAIIIATKNEWHTNLNQFNSYSYLTLLFSKVKKMTVKTRDIGDHLPVTRILRQCPGISGKLKIQLKRYVKFVYVTWKTSSKQVLSDLLWVSTCAKSSTILCAKTEADSSDRSMLDKGPSLLKTKWWSFLQ